MRSVPSHRFPARQRGATLVVAMLILVLIMMIGITAVSTSDTQFKLAGNLQFQDSALNNAEAAIAEGERWLSTGTNYNNAGFTTYNKNTTPQLLPIGRLAGLAAPANTAWTMDWNDENSVAVGGARYFIEQMSRNNKLSGSSVVVGRPSSTACNQVNTYLITARGASARGATKLVQSYFSVLSCPT